MKFHAEKQDSGTLLIVEHEGQQWAVLIRNSDFENHYDPHFLFWIAILNLKYSALGLWKYRRTMLDFSADLEAIR